MFNLAVKLNTMSGDIHITRYSKPIGSWTGKAGGRKVVTECTPDSLKRSGRRRASEIRDIALSNPFDKFGALTLNKEVIDRYDFNEISRRIRKHLHNYRQRKNKKLIFLIVPEFHQDGAVHFHALLGGVQPGEMHDSGKRDKAGRKIYNWKGWPFGFTDFTEVEDLQKAGNYMVKYITKNIRTGPPGRKAYYITRGLERPQRKLYLTGPEQAEEVIQSYEKKRRRVYANTFTVGQGVEQQQITRILLQETV